MAKLTPFYGEHGLQLLPNFPEVVIARADVLQRWPADLSDQIGVRSSPRAAGEPEIGRPPAYEEALMVFSERLQRGVTCPVRLDEVAHIHGRMGGAIKKETITSTVKQFYKQLEWGDRKVMNSTVVIDAIGAYLDERRRIRVEAARKRNLAAG